MAECKPWLATFEYMILPINGLANDPKGPFVVEVYGGRRLGSMNPYYKSCLIPTRNGFSIKGFRNPKKAMQEVEGGFRRKIDDWKQV